MLKEYELVIWFTAMVIACAVVFLFAEDVAGWL